MNRELREFIQQALRQGQSRDAIRQALLESGWQESEIRNGLAAFAPIDFPIPVPRPAPNLYAREAFFYLVSFIALYVSAISYGLVAFGLIDHAFPDILDYRESYPSPGQATAIASVIVAFPLYLFLTRHLARQAAADPERRQSPVRRWLTYFTLVVAAGIILGDIIALLANVLTGDPTTRFALKALSVLAISAAVFGFYLWDMRQSETPAAPQPANKALRPLTAATILAVTGCIAYALVLMGTPSQQRDLRLDNERRSDLANIASNIDQYWQLNDALPAQLSDLYAPRYNLNRIDDPETGTPYEYRPLDGLDGARYELCAVFATDTAESPPRQPGYSQTAWAHGKGRVCFGLEAQAP